MRTSLKLASLATLLVLALVVLPVGAAATPSSTDPTWGSSGLARLAETARLSFGVASDDAPGGGVAIGGARTNFQFNEDDVDLDVRVHPTIQRLLANGQPDTTFGSANGTSVLYLQDHFSIATDVDALADGRTYVAGTSLGLLSAKTFVARLQPGGALDPTFGAGGSTTILPEAYNAIIPVAVREVSGGGVLVVATSFTGDLLAIGPDDEDDDSDEEDEQGPPPVMRTTGDFDVLLLRLTSAGALDATFGGGDGIVELDLLGAQSLDIATAAEIASDGSAVFAGTSIPRKTWFARALVAKVRADGSLDGGFGTNGIVAQPSRHDRFDVATDIGPRPGGGYAFPVVSELEDGAIRTFVRRVDAAGAKVAWAGGDLGAEAPEGMIATSIATLGDGRTMLGGIGSRYGADAVLDDDFVGAIARLRATGTADRSFDRRGVRYVGASSEELRVSIFRGLHPAPDGTVVATGTIDGVAGAIRLRGDTASGRARDVQLRARLVRPALSRCGFDRRHPCHIDVRDDTARISMRFGASPGLPVGHPLVVRIDRDDDDGYFWDSETVGLRVGQDGTALLRGHRLIAEGGVHRIRAFVDATDTTWSARSRPFYVRVVGPADDDDWEDDVEELGSAAAPSAPTRAARTACASSGTARGLLWANVRIACDAARRRSADSK